MSERRILLTGCHGMLGQRIVEGIHGDYFLLGTDIDEKPLIHGKQFQYSQLDITDRKEVLSTIREYSPDWVINTSAFTDVDDCEIKKELCWRVNVEGVENLVYAAKRVKTKIIHFSSDYIFDNSRTEYLEENRAAPLSYYGKAKLASENILRTSGIEWALFRTSTMYDVDLLKGRTNFVTWVIQNLQRGNRLRIVTDQWGNPSLARNIAESAWRVLDQNKEGVYHTAGKEIIDRYSFTKEIAEIFDLDKSLITPVLTEDLGQKAQRPLKIGMNVEKAERELGMKFLGVKEGLTVFKKDFLDTHRNN